MRDMRRRMTVLEERLAKALAFQDLPKHMRGASVCAAGLLIVRAVDMSVIGAQRSVLGGRSLFLYLPGMRCVVA